MTQKHHIRLTLLLLACGLLAMLAAAQDPGSGMLILWEQEDNSVSGVVDVFGWAAPPGMQSYFLEAALHDPEGQSDPFWIPATLPSRSVVMNGLLGQWNTAVLPDGLYELRLHVVLGSGESVYYSVGPIAVANRGSVATAGPVRVLETPGPAVLTATPSPTATPAPVLALPSGSPDVTLELGGHVLYFDERTHDAMRRSGMSWAKFQLVYRLGDTVDAARDVIRRGQAAGFKVLLGIVGIVEELRDKGADYYPLYAEFLGQVAALGPDAIEVWNEMNIDREWPTGRIDPAAYAEMLRQAYTAIKAVNPDIMVITGALAPTGAEGAFGLSRVWNDDRYYLGMANAGVAEYADCIGVHYNEGIIPPVQQGGDPRDSYPTRYFPLMLERVAWPFRNSGLPLCFTELGYLTPEGFDSPLPGGFAWARSTTVAQQAEWLAQAVTIASNYQRLPVRLIIVWNVDFDRYDDDPQGAYAIIRPDGTCPACEALGDLAR